MNKYTLFFFFTFLNLQLLSMNTTRFTWLGFLLLNKNKLTEFTNTDFNKLDSSGLTALHQAILFNNATVVKQLLMLGADINVVDSYGRTTTDLAVKTSSNEILSCLKIMRKKEPVVDIDLNNKFIDGIKKLKYDYLLTSVKNGYIVLWDHLILASNQYKEALKKCSSGYLLYYRTRILKLLIESFKKQFPQKKLTKKLNDLYKVDLVSSVTYKDY